MIEIRQCLEKKTQHFLISVNACQQKRKTRENEREKDGKRERECASGKTTQKKKHQ
jgi:hypothetical protein